MFLPEAFKLSLICNQPPPPPPPQHTHPQETNNIEKNPSNLQENLQLIKNELHANDRTCISPFQWCRDPGQGWIPVRERAIGGKYVRNTGPNEGNPFCANTQQFKLGQYSRGSIQHTVGSVKPIFHQKLRSRWPPGGGGGGALHTKFTRMCVRPKLMDMGPFLASSE